MHVHFLDPYRPRMSLVHELDPRVKFVLTVSFILALALMPTGAWPAYLMAMAIVLSVVILSELGLGYVLKRSALALPFVLAALPLLFTVKGEPLFRVALGAWNLSAYVEGLERFASIAVKSWLSVQVAIVMASSTPFPELLVAMRAVKIPRLLVAVFGLMWRYLFVLADEALRLMRARAARSGESDMPGTRMGGSLTWRARVAGGMAGNLFLRGFERSDRIYVAMISRGYDGEVRTLSARRIGRSHQVVLWVGLGILIFLLIFANLFWG